MYILDFFPYPSGEGLSVGHGKNYVPSDVLARYYRMRGYAVLHPMGWDAFGLPAENEALLRGRHPRETTREYAATYRRQLDLLGCSYDWSKELFTSDPGYYRWTQWGFLLLLERGLAYRATGWQWWCPRCGTILANEQVERGRCWRHTDTPVKRRALEQWYVRTTAYAERLLEDLETVDWPERIKVMQRNWIGRSEGVDVTFPVSRGEAATIVVFTTRVETIYGATFIALAPEHPLISAICAPAQRSVVEAYVEASLRRAEVERMQEQAHPTGVFTGTQVMHPLTSEPIPIFVADYVLAHYGTGAIMGVPAHDARDYAFASAHGISIRAVIAGSSSDATIPLTGEGPLINSAAHDGLIGSDARAAVTSALTQAGRGMRSVRYRMRDWLISRQRYWGAPIPVVYCDACGAVPVPADQLPVRLPDVDQYTPAGTGRSPLESIPEFVRTRCPHCGGDAQRETDTLDGFADSNWYFLRFVDPAYEEGPWNPRHARYWLPVDWYLGGAEHAVMHLLYARFFTKVLYDAGLVSFAEPFQRLRTQGSMLSPVDGLRMSKSRGNVITPDEVVAEHGADALRVYELFIGPFDHDVTWNPAGVAGTARFVRRLYRLVLHGLETSEPRGALGSTDQVWRRVHRLVKLSGEMIEGFRFNGLVAELMAFLNELEAWEAQWAGTALWREVLEIFVRLVAPITPFLAEELWARGGHVGSVHRAPWPSYDSALARSQTHTLIIQVDGRVRDRVSIDELDRESLIRLAASRERVRDALGTRTIRTVIVVPHRVVNFVTGATRTKS